jgi:stage V sporulation protein R
LDPERSRKVLEYVKRVWRRPVLLKTIDEAAQPVEFSADSAAAA